MIPNTMLFAKNSLEKAARVVDAGEGKDAALEVALAQAAAITALAEGLANLRCDLDVHVQQVLAAAQHRASAEGEHDEGGASAGA